MAHGPRCRVCGKPFTAAVVTYSASGEYITTDWEPKCRHDVCDKCGTEKINGRYGCTCALPRKQPVVEHDPYELLDDEDRTQDLVALLTELDGIERPLAPANRRKRRWFTRP